MQLSGPPPSYPEQQALVRHLAQVFHASGEFTLIEAIDQARVPILKLQHAASPLKCDLSIGNELAVQKTRFLHAFVLRDSRVRPLCLIVKHCAPPLTVATHCTRFQHPQPLIFCAAITRAYRLLQGRPSAI